MGAGIQAKIPALPNNHHTVDCVFMLGTKGKKYLFLANSRPEFELVFNKFLNIFNKKELN